MEIFLQAVRIIAVKLARIGKYLDQKQTLEFFPQKLNYGNEVLQDIEMVRKVNKTTTTLRRNAKEKRKNVGEMKFLGRNN